MGWQGLAQQTGAGAASNCNVSSIPMLKIGHMLFPFHPRDTASSGTTFNVIKDKLDFHHTHDILHSAFSNLNPDQIWQWNLYYIQYIMYITYTVYIIQESKMET